MQGEPAAIKLGDVDDNGEAEPRSRRGLVEPTTSLQDFSHGALRQTGAIIVDQQRDPLGVRCLFDRKRDLDGGRGPFEGVVEEIAQHLLQILLLAAEA